MESLKPKYTYTVNLDDNSAAARVLRMVGNNKTVLEIGCASGSQTRALKEQLHCSVTGIEIDENAAKSAKPYCDDLIIGDVESPGLLEHLRTRTFDVIVLADVIEHLRNPRVVLRKIKQYLTNGGFIVASIPNIVHASIVYEMARGKFNYQPEGLLDDTHVRFFTKQSVLETFEGAGFIVDTLDRLIVNPNATEFHTRPVTKEDQALLDYILANSQEARTYQFLIRAIAASHEPQYLPAAALLAQERIAALQTALNEQNKRIRHLESELAWVDHHPLLRLLKRTKRFIVGTENDT